MNRKINWMRRSRMNATARSIPIRFGRGAGGFEVKIKSAASNRIRILDLEEAPLVQGLFYLNGRMGSIAAMQPLPRFRRESVMASVTLPETMKLQAVLKPARKKRC